VKLKLTRNQLNFICILDAFQWLVETVLFSIFLKYSEVKSCPAFSPRKIHLKRYSYLLHRSAHPKISTRTRRVEEVNELPITLHSSVTDNQPYASRRTLIYVNRAARFNRYAIIDLCCCSNGESLASYGLRHWLEPTWRRLRRRQRQRHVSRHRSRRESRRRRCGGGPAFLADSSAFSISGSAIHRSICCYHRERAFVAVLSITISLACPLPCILEIDEIKFLGNWKGCDLQAVLKLENLIFYKLE